MEKIQQYIKKLQKTKIYTMYKTNNKAKLITALILVFLFGWLLRGCFADKIAYINLQQVVANSRELSAIQVDYAQKQKDFNNWLQQANKDIDKEKQKAKKESIAKEYQEMAHKKEVALRAEYNQRFSKVDRKLRRIMRRAARSHGCNIIMSNTSVVYGGTDITAQVIKAVKRSEAK